jgi:hypothetical protein
MASAQLYLVLCVNLFESTTTQLLFQASAPLLSAKCSASRQTFSDLAACCDALSIVCPNNTRGRSPIRRPTVALSAAARVDASESGDSVMDSIHGRSSVPEVSAASHHHALDESVADSDATIPDFLPSRRLAPALSVPRYII